VLERDQGLAAIAIDEIEVVVLFQEDSGVLGKLQQMEQGETRLVDVSQTLLTR
jgi:hypothetical protein